MVKMLFSENSFRLTFFMALLVIEFLATTTTVHIEIIENIWDKANHFTAFFTLYILLSFAYKNFGVLSKALWLIAFGLQIEIVQSFIDGRYFSLLDIVADGVGVFVGMAFTRLLIYYTR